MELTLFIQFLSLCSLSVPCSLPLCKDLSQLFPKGGWMFSTDAFWESRWDCLAVKGQAEESLSISAPQLRVLLWSTWSTKPLFFSEACYSGAEWQLFCQQQKCTFSI